MLTLMDCASIEEAISVTTHENVIRNRVVSPCGRFESFELNGFHFDVDWNEINPPGTDPHEEGMLHEDFMEELDRFMDELEKQP